MNSLLGETKLQRSARYHWIERCPFNNDHPIDHPIMPLIPPSLLPSCMIKRRRPTCYNNRKMCCICHAGTMTSLFSTTKLRPVTDVDTSQHQPRPVKRSCEPLLGAKDQSITRKQWVGRHPQNGFSSHPFLLLEEHYNQVVAPGRMLTGIILSSLLTPHLSSHMLARWSPPNGI